jgi:hypothetical protein
MDWNCKYYLQEICVPKFWGYDWAAQFLGKINRETRLSRLWGFSNLRHDCQGTWTPERLRWRGPAANINYSAKLSSERAPHMNKPATAIK